jgi:hypothetical protein
VEAKELRIVKQNRVLTRIKNFAILIVNVHVIVHVNASEAGKR